MKKNNSTLPTDALKTIDQTLSGANKINNAKDVKFGTIPFVYELPKSMKQACNFDMDSIDNEESDGNFCTKIDIHLAKIEPVWIEQLVNKEITNDDNPKLIKFKHTVDEFVNEHLLFINDLKTVAKENGEEFSHAPSYAWSVKPEIVSSVNNVVQISLIGDTYMGGAHGMPFLEYLLFDMDLQTQIGFSDVIFSEKVNDFHELAYQSFKEYLNKELKINTDSEIKDYESTWKFELTENFYFGKDGLVLVYQPYEMGSYAQGFIEIVVPYHQLGDILKGQYVPSKEI